MGLFSDNLCCPRCGRAAYTVFGCADRKQGLCPFVQRWSDLSIASNMSCGGMLMLGFLVASFAASVQGAWGWLAAALVVVFLVLATRDVQFYYPQAGMMVQSTVCLGLELSRRVMKKGPPLSLPLRLLRPLRYPLSIVALGDQPRISAEEDPRAVSVFRAALVDLLLKGLIEIQPIAYYGRGTGQSAHVTKVEHTIVPRYDVGTQAPVGALEARIVRIISDRSRDQQDKDGWLDGPRVFDLVRAWFPDDVPNPHGALLSAVERDAVKLDLCQIERASSRGPTEKVAWRSQSIDDLRADMRTADDLEQQFQRMDCNTWERLWAQISDGLRSRIERSAD